MTIRRSQVAFVVALMLPLIIAAFGAPPSGSTVAAQTRPPAPAGRVAPRAASAANRMVGPNFPVLVDSNGNGKPDEGVDEAMTPTLRDPQVSFRDRWACPGGTDFFTFSNRDSSGKYASVTHLGSDGRSQTVTRSSASSVSYKETRVTGVVAATGNLSAVDANRNGIFEGFTETGFMGTVSMSFVYFDVNGDGFPDYVSIPWAQAALVGVRFGGSCGGSDPQVFVPLADSDGDGIPDSIVLDLDGNGVADPQFYPSPRLAPEAPPPTPTPTPTPIPVPTLPEWAMIVLMVLVATAGLTAVRKRFV